MNQIPDGFMEDSTGALRRVDSIKQIDLLRDELVKKIIARAAAINEQLRQLKDEALAEISAFVELSAAEHNVKLGGKKGNVQLRSFDGKYKVIRARHEFMTFDEQLEAAKELFMECAQYWAGVPGVPADLVILVEYHFRLNKNGDVSVTEVMKLMQYPIKDDRWKRAVEILNKSLSVQSTVTYLRIQERVGNTDQYKSISLDIAGV